VYPLPLCTKRLSPWIVPKGSSALSDHSIWRASREQDGHMKQPKWPTVVSIRLLECSLRGQTTNKAPERMVPFVNFQGPSFQRVRKTNNQKRTRQYERNPKLNCVCDLKLKVVNASCGCIHVNKWAKYHIQRKACSLCVIINLVDIEIEWVSVSVLLLTSTSTKPCTPQEYNSSFANTDKSRLGIIWWVAKRLKMLSSAIALKWRNSKA